ncbi:zinc-ribbon domain-containing protein [Salinibacterium sp. G-O1]|uniref:zinc-ribbon domain-containing protein n=1 Tax=Salinibacterium sp. G-O1 TaxID=3046208 RepID=UPI0024BA8277|nr:zinc-ribbon domain-containing protein [Salinibacterium sp. G-O1]MDJ0334942.1 zinc-ribbon domain-containing protein [Salinibacterium sp. G-O1]
MPEQVEAWWARRQSSKGATTPYPIGAFRDAWMPYPVLIRQYHPDLNFGIVLSQIPPAADVYLLWQCESGHLFAATPWEQRQRPGRSRRRSTWCPECSMEATGRPATAPRRKPAADLCPKTPSLAVGASFHSECAPRPASAAEELLRQKLTARLNFQSGVNAVRVAQPFFTHLEVWPDILIPELMVAIEYDTTGRDGLEHVGTREPVDRRKDRLLRRTGWEVVRVRGGKLHHIGPFDVTSATVTGKLIDRVVDRLCEIRGDLIVNSYLA